MSFSGLAVQASANRFSAATAVTVRFRAESSPRAQNGGGEPTQLAALGAVCSFSRNETIFDEGEEVTALYKIASGVVRLCRVTEDGRRQIAGFRFPGDIIGVDWAGQYELTAEAASDVTAIRFARSRVERLTSDDVAVRDHILAHIRHDLQSAHEHLLTLGCQSAAERVASFLLQLVRRASVGEGETLDMQLDRQDIADYLGLTLETVSRTFSEFQSRAIIALPQRRHVRILSLAKLRSQALRVN